MMSQGRLRARGTIVRPAVQSANTFAFMASLVCGIGSISLIRTMTSAKLPITTDACSRSPLAIASSSANRLAAYLNGSASMGLMAEVSTTTGDGHTMRVVGKNPDSIPSRVAWGNNVRLCTVANESVECRAWYRSTVVGMYGAISAAGTWK